MSIPESWTKLEDTTRKDSYTSTELEVAIDADTFDSIEFQPTLAPKTADLSTPSMGSLSEPPKPVPTFVKNLVLSSRALRKTGRKKACEIAYTMRRQAGSLGNYRSKGEFGRVFKDIRPPKIENPVPGYISSLHGDAYVKYALERGEEAVRELKEDGLEKDERVMKVEQCVEELRVVLAK